VWVAVPGTSFYLVRFYLGTKEIFRARPSRPRLLLPDRWSFGGHRYSLSPGRYLWSVRPAFGGSSRPRFGWPIVQARLVIQRSSGG
jgi:hypothetical protein